MGGSEKGYDPSRQGDHHHVLGSLPSAKDARAAAKSLKGIKCRNQFPDHNCVDWTKKAVDHLHAQGHIDATKHAEFMDHYNTHQANVRAATSTAENKHGAHHAE